MRKIVLSVLIVLAIVGFSVNMEDIIRASKDLKTVRCFITAENHVRGRTTVVEFEFAFKRDGSKMRIEYTYPKNMKGSIVAIDGEYIYNYIPSLNRKMKKRLDPKSSKNPGKDMGILYDFILGDLDSFLKSWSFQYSGEEKLKIEGKEIESQHFTFRSGSERQEVWFNENSFPIKIEMYKNGKLAIRLIVSKLETNVEINDEYFRPF